MKKQKLYVIRKYIKATSAKDAIKKDKRTEVDDVWIDEKWQGEDIIMGFQKK
jgi:hypothetical protein